MIFCKQNQLSDIFLTKEHEIYILNVRGHHPGYYCFDHKSDLIEKLAQLKIEGYRIPDFVFGALEEV